MKILGYALIGIAGALMAKVGITVHQWECWAIITCFIIGEFLVCNGDKM